MPQLDATHQSQHDATVRRFTSPHYPTRHDEIVAAADHRAQLYQGQIPLRRTKARNRQVD